MKTIVFAILMLVGCVAFGQTKEVLMLDQIDGYSNKCGIFIYRQNAEPEHIPPGKAKFSSQAGDTDVSELCFESISKLYMEGWEIKAMMQLNSLSRRYIFEREKP